LGTTIETVGALLIVGARAGSAGVGHTSRVRATRAIVAIVGVVIALWFLLGARQAHQLTRAMTIVQSQRLTASQAAAAARLLRSAHTLNPDRSVVLAQAQLADRRGQFNRALRLADSVADAEPMNAHAWYAVAQYAAAADDTPLERSSFVHVRALVPPVK
jgi:hypothetical protein